VAGHKQALDVATVAQGQVRFHSILMLSWGMCVVMYLVANGVEVLRYKATSCSTWHSMHNMFIGMDHPSTIAQILILQCVIIAVSQVLLICLFLHCLGIASLCVLKQCSSFTVLFWMILTLAGQHQIAAVTRPDVIVVWTRHSKL